ncbi:MAG: HD domain-containing phosphohydrolase [Candidatus Brocadiales bacterium]
MKGITRFGRNTFLWFLLVALLPLTAVGVITYIDLRLHIKGTAFDDLQHDAHKYRDHTQTFLNAWLWTAEAFSSDGFIKDAVLEITSGTGNKSDIVKQLNKHLRTSKKDLYRDISEVFVLDGNGIVIASSNDVEVGENFSRMAYFRKPFINSEETGGKFAGEVESQAVPGRFHLVFSHILKDMDYQLPVGVLVMKVKLNSLQIITKPSIATFTDTTNAELLATAYIMNKDGWLLAYSSPPGQEMSSQHIDTKNVFRVFGTGTESVGEYKNYLGTEVLGATLLVSETDWAVTTEINAHEILAPLRRLGYMFGGIAGFSLLLIFGLSFAISRGINKSIKELILGTERIATGDLDYRISLKRKDELRTLSDSFNTMTHSLKTSNEERERLFSVVEKAKVEWENTFDSIHDAILSCDANHKIIRVNRGASRMLGIDLNELINMKWHDAVGKLSGFEQLARDALEGLEPLSREVCDREKDKTFLASIYPMVGNDGTFQGSVQILHDITDIKKAEIELEERRVIAMAKLAELAEKRDLETGHHLIRIRGYCQVLADELRKQPKYSGIIDDQFIKSLPDASMLHDIGKVGIPDSVLLKPGRLDPEEFGIIKTHTVTGDEVLAGPEYFKMAREICRHHHERYDGKGYPDGLKGEDIPLSARIVTLADTYDAIVSERPYSKPRTHEQARAIILQESGKQFCPDVVRAFINREDDFRALSRSTPG